MEEADPNPQGCLWGVPLSVEEVTANKVETARKLSGVWRSDKIWMSEELIFMNEWMNEWRKSGFMI